MMRTIRFGLMGPGRIAERFAAAFGAGAVPGAYLAAVASHTDTDRAWAFADTWGVPTVYPDYPSLVAAPDIDIVYVATTNQCHFACCQLALQAGKAVLCEKPMAVTAAQAQALAALAARQGVFLMEAVFTRFMPAVQRAMQWVRQGRIGGLRAVSANLCAARDPAQFQRLYDPAFFGGALYDLGVYGLQLVQHFAGERPLCGVAAASMPSGTGVDESTFVTLRYRDGFVGEVKCSIGWNSPCDAFLYGEVGYIRFFPHFNFAQQVELYTPPYPKGYELTPASPTEVFTMAPPTPLAYEAAHAADCVRQGRTESDIMPLAHSVQLAHIYETALAQCASPKGGTHP